VRKKLGIGPGSVLEWQENGENMIVRRSGTFSSQDIHQALFPRTPPKARTLDELNEGIRQHARERNARD
jgi:bifunctional DNA-binding transcriptional regulator/antitoxin component of YhaV-PrlF toxin-antitoxin module